MSQPDTVQLRYTRANLHRNQYFTLSPGRNLVSKEDFEKASKLPGFQRRIKEGLIVVIPEKDAKELSPEQVIAESFDVPWLRLQAKQKGAIGKAAKARIKEIDEIGGKEIKDATTPDGDTPSLANPNSDGEEY